jgi:hypothetical protein
MFALLTRFLHRHVPRCPIRGCRKRTRNLERHYDRAHGGIDGYDPDA